MFGDWLWNPGRTQVQETRLQNWLRGLKQLKAKVAVVEIGAGSAIPTVRLLSESVARDTGGMLIRINPREAEIARGGAGLLTTAADGIQRICERL